MFDSKKLIVAVIFTAVAFMGFAWREAPSEMSQNVPNEPRWEIVVSDGVAQSRGFVAGDLEFYQNIPPAYPEIAREKGWQGVVLLEVAVEPDGKASDVKICRSSGYKILDESALKTLKNWRFQPVSIGSKPVPTQTRIPVRFLLESDEYLNALKASEV